VAAKAISGSDAARKLAWKTSDEVAWRAYQQQSGVHDEK